MFGHFTTLCMKGLTHFILLVSFHTPCKHQKTRVFTPFSSALSMTLNKFDGYKSFWCFQRVQKETGGIRRVKALVYQKKHPSICLIESCSEKFHGIHRKTAAMESSLQFCPWKLQEIAFCNSFCTDYFWATASVSNKLVLHSSQTALCVYRWASWSNQLIKTQPHDFRNLI